MGKGDIKKSRMFMTLVMRASDHPFIKQNRLIFKVPITEDKEERDKVFEEQVFSWLVALSNKYENYDIAIGEVQRWLRSFVQNHPDRYEWVDRMGNEAGERFLKAVKQAKKEDKGIIKINLKAIFNRLFG